jgi:hypothetical protein
MLIIAKLNFADSGLVKRASQERDIIQSGTIITTILIR